MFTVRIDNAVPLFLSGARPRAQLQRTRLQFIAFSNVEEWKQTKSSCSKFICILWIIKAAHKHIHIPIHITRKEKKICNFHGWQQQQHRSMFHRRWKWNDRKWFPILSVTLKSFIAWNRIWIWLFNELLHFRNSSRTHTHTLAYIHSHAWMKWFWIEWNDQNARNGLRCCLQCSRAVWCAWWCIRIHMISTQLFGIFWIVQIILLEFETSGPADEKIDYLWGLDGSLSMSPALVNEILGEIRFEKHKTQKFSKCPTHITHELTEFRTNFWMGCFLFTQRQRHQLNFHHILMHSEK